MINKNQIMYEIFLLTVTDGTRYQNIEDESFDSERDESYKESLETKLGHKVSEEDVYQWFAEEGRFMSKKDLIYGYVIEHNESEINSSKKINYDFLNKEIEEDIFNEDKKNSKIKSLKRK